MLYLLQVQLIDEDRAKQLNFIQEVDMAKKLISALLLMFFAVTTPAFAEKKNALIDQGGTKYEVSGSKLYIIFAGKKTSVKDGIYNFRDGTRIVIEEGKITKKTKIKKK